MTTKISDNILMKVDDLVSDFLYYDRSEDEDLPLGVIEKAIQNGDVSVEEITKHFKLKLIESI